MVSVCHGAPPGARCRDRAVIPRPNPPPPSPAPSRFSWSEATAIGLALLSQSTSLTEISMYGTKLVGFARLPGVESLRAIGGLRGFVSLRNLTLGGASVVDLDILIGLLRATRSLTELNISSSTAGDVFVTDDVVRAFSPCTALTSLALSGPNKLSGSVGLSQLSALTSIYLGQCNHGDNVMRCLSGCSALTSLRMTHSDTISSVGLQHALASSSALTHLELRNCTSVDDAAVKTIAAAGNALQSLDLTGCANITDRGAGQLSACAALETLRLDGCGVSMAVRERLGPDVAIGGLIWAPEPGGEG